MTDSNATPFYEPRITSYQNDHGALVAEVEMLNYGYAVELFTGPEESTTEFYMIRRDAHAVAKCHTERYS